MKLTRRDKRVLAAGFLIAVGIVAWSYVLAPMQQRWKKARVALHDDRQDLEKLRRIAEERDRYAADRQRVLRMVYETPDLLAAQRVVPALINDVQGIGQDAGVQITRYEPLPPKVEDTYATYALTLACQGSLEKLVAFLYDLQAHRPVIVARRLHVIPPGPEAKTPDLSIELVLSTYAILTPESLAVAQEEEAETV